MRVEVFNLDYAFTGRLETIKGNQSFVARSDEFMFWIGFNDFMVVVVIVSVSVVIVVIVMVIVVVFVVPVATSHATKLNLS